MGQPLFMFQLSPSPHLVTYHFTYCQIRIKHHSFSMSTWGVTILSLTPHPDTGKGPFSTRLNPVPKFQHFSIFIHFYTLLIECKKKKNMEELPILLHRLQNSRLGLKTLFCAQVLGPSSCLKRLLTKTGNKALLIEIVLRHIQYSISDTFKCKSLSILYMNI